MMHKAKLAAELADLEKTAALSSLAIGNLQPVGSGTFQMPANYAELLRFSVTDVERRIKEIRAML